MKFWHKIFTLTAGFFRAGFFRAGFFEALPLIGVLGLVLALSFGVGALPGLAAPNAPTAPNAPNAPNAPTATVAPETVHLFLKINDKIVQGETTKTGAGREGAIECLSYDQAMIVPRDRDGRVRARRFYAPIRIVKRIDKSSPLLARALTESQPVSATFKFYRPSQADAKAIEQFYTVTMEQGRIASVRQYAPSASGGASAASAAAEEVSFIFRKISWTYEPGRISHQDAAPYRE